MINSINNSSSYRNIITNKKAQNTFQQTLTTAQLSKDSFVASFNAAKPDWLNGLRSRYNVSSMGWMQGQRLVSELVGRGLIRNDLKDLGNKVVIMFPPDCTDENGNLTRVVSGSECAELAFDAGFENTTDYMGTLKSSLEHQWQAYNSMVERYGDIYPNEKTYLQEQEKLLGILHGMANA